MNRPSRNHADLPHFSRGPRGPRFLKPAFEIHAQPRLKAPARSTSESRTCTASASFGLIVRSGANNCSFFWHGASSSKTSIERIQPSRWLSLISPRYKTCRWTIRPSEQRRFSTILQQRCSLPSLRRKLHLKNMTASHCSRNFFPEKRLGLHYSHLRTSPPFIYAAPRTTNHQKIGFFRSSSESRGRRFPSLPRMAVHTEGG
jgi:hypothetical protein